jgi:MFS family permease
MLVTVGLPLIFIAREFYVIALLSIALGLGEAAIMPAIISLATELSAQGNYGSTLGLLDAMDNIGKALGPILAGLLISSLGYSTSFLIIPVFAAVTGVFHKLRVILGYVSVREQR